MRIGENPITKYLKYPHYHIPPASAFWSLMVKWFWLSISEKRRGMRPFSVFSWQPCDVYRVPIPQLGNQPYHSPVTNNQHSLPTTEHYALRHLPAVSTACLSCFNACVLVRSAYDGFACAQWIVSTLRWIAAQFSVPNLANEPYGETRCSCCRGPLTLRQEDQLSNPNGAFYPPITSPPYIDTYAVLPTLFISASLKDMMITIKPCVRQRAIPRLECNCGGEVWAGCFVCKQITGWHRWAPPRGGITWLLPTCCEKNKHVTHELYMGQCPPMQLGKREKQGNIRR